MSTYITGSQINFYRKEILSPNLSPVTTPKSHTLWELQMLALIPMVQEENRNNTSHSHEKTHL